MNAPFYKFGAFGDEVSLIVAFIIGIGFGFVLERAGFGSARKLAAQFYFRDMAVFKVMFTAIVTAMAGLYFLGRVGFLDLSLIYLTPTFLIPQIVGGLILGAGFVVGGYCPGTSVVSAGTGRIDGMVYMVGVIIGLIGYAEVYPLIADWTEITSMGHITLPGLFAIPYGLVVTAVVVMAVVGFVAAELMERWLGADLDSPDSLVGRPWRLTPARGLMVGLLVLGFIALVAGDPYRGSRAVLDTKQLALIVEGERDGITVEDLADRIIQGQIDFTLLDMREAESFQRYHIPTARNLPLSQWVPGDLPRNEKIILYSDSEVHAAQAWFLMQAQGYRSVYQLLGGVDGWMNEILYPAGPMASQAESDRRAEIARFFGGSPRSDSGQEDGKAQSSPPEMALPVMPAIQDAPVTAPKRKRREGC